MSSKPKRSIDFLRPEQLQRKREGDRRNQALQRNRTKAYVQHLEQKVEQLEGRVRALEAEAELQRKVDCPDMPISFDETILDMNYGTLCISEMSLGAVTDDPSELWTYFLRDTTLLPSPPSPPSQSVSMPVATPSPTTYVPLAPSSWTTLPKHIAPTCTIDHVVINLIATRRRLDNMAEFQRHDFPSVQSLLNPTSSTGASPVTSVIVKQIIHAMAVPTLPEQIAILYVMSTIIRWHISPTRANYASIPPWLRPTPAQLIYPHAPWLDLFVWPRGRDRFVQHPRYQHAHDAMARLCNASLSINWAHQPSDMFTSESRLDQSDIVLNPMFERHIRNLDNWTVGQSVLDV